MRRRTGILGLAAVILLAFVTVTLLRRPPNPIYQGKRLSTWLHIYGQRYSTPRPAARDVDQAERAIRHIGTNALPFLLDRLNYEPPISRYPICRHLPEWILQSGPFWNLLANPKADGRATAARDALGLLGEAALPAIPELVRRASLKGPFARSQNSMIALVETLHNVDHPPLPVLAVMLSVPDPSVFLDFQELVRELGTNARPLVPVLVQNLRSTNSTFVAINAGLLGDLGLEPDVAVPALTKCLQDPDAYLRAAAARALARFPEDASAALPALTKALSDPDPDVRIRAVLAIQTISPRVHTNVPAQ